MPVIGWDGMNVTVGGLVRGFSYRFSYYYADGQVGGWNIDDPVNSSEVIMVVRNQIIKVCIQLKCSSQSPVCAQ
jgi:hypothetical protein